MSSFPVRALCATTALCAVFQTLPLDAQTATQAPGITGNELNVTITANRGPTAIQRTGSAITVIGSEEITRANPGSVVEALRGVPGLDITETGGPGAVTSVRLRGGNSGQTLVLIDGIRVGDPSGVSNDFDFATLAPGLIERIEVLRGPQSALYGSDAMGGVVNIITKRGRGPFQAYAQVEGGSYSTLNTNLGVHGTSGDWNYAFAGSAAKSAGFSRYGYRLGRIENTRPPLDNDGFTRFGGYGRIGYDPGNGFRFEVGAQSITTHSKYDAGFGTLPDTPSAVARRFDQIWAKVSLDTLGNRLTHNVTVFANRTDRTDKGISFGNNVLPNNTFWTNSDFIGDRFGMEYQGELKLDTFGKLSFGGKMEQENAKTFSTGILPRQTARVMTLDKTQVTRSLFTLWQLPIGERIDFSLGGRSDNVDGVAQFNTWRATGAYRITETGTKLRASAGTGGKAPTLFQLHSPLFGNAMLEPEKNYGHDAGIDQSLFGGRVLVSATAFSNIYKNLIDFDTVRNRYINVARAKTSGVELSADVEVIPQFLRFKGAYTYLQAKDRLTNLTLARRPQQTAKLSLIISPTANWTIEPSVILVDGRFSGTRETQRLAPYARLDVYTDYKIDETWKVYARGENLTNARYQEVYNYGTTGRAAYAGLKATW